MIRSLEPELLRQAMHLANGNQARAARWLGISRLRLREKLRQHQLHPLQDAAESTPPPGGVTVESNSIWG
jgi:DNA-binding NtrC family response regulator